MHVIFGKCIQVFRERLSETSSSRWLGRPIGSGGEDVIDENRFHNCVGESEKALLVPVSTKGYHYYGLYTAAIENKNPIMGIHWSAGLCDNLSYCASLPRRRL